MQSHDCPCQGRPQRSCAPQLGALTALLLAHMHMSPWSPQALHCCAYCGAHRHLAPGTRTSTQRIHSATTQAPPARQRRTPQMQCTGQGHHHSASVIRSLCTQYDAGVGRWHSMAAAAGAPSAVTAPHRPHLPPRTPRPRCAASCQRTAATQSAPWPVPRAAGGRGQATPPRWR